MAEPRQTGNSVPVIGTRDRFASLLSSKIVGQPSALETILPSIHLHRSGLAPEDRPVGAFLLLGPTGTGKTKTVEAIAEVLHGSARTLLRIDCGEFQSDHEIAKLIGAPPGYVGHFDSKPRLSQENIDAARSDRSDLALILFDEIEKASPAMAPLLLSILDRGTLTLGSGDEVDLSRTLIFFTSNLGARQMKEEIAGGLGFAAGTGEVRSPAELRARLEGIGQRAVHKHFSPEFLNRIDAIVTYHPLGVDSLVAILEHQVYELQQHVHSRLGRRSFEIEVAPAARYFMIDKGTSLEYGARELRRVIHRYLTQPVAEMVAMGKIVPGSTVMVDMNEDAGGLVFKVEEGKRQSEATASTVLTVDGSPDLLKWMERVLGDRECVVYTAASTVEARARVEAVSPNFALVDSVLPDGDGIQLARSLIEQHPGLRVVITSGIELDDEDELVCEAHDFFVLPKPFLSDELVDALEAQGMNLMRVREEGG